MLECIGRVAEVKYVETNGLSLAEKMGLVMDELFALVGFERKAVGAQAEEESASDDDY